MVRVRVRLSVRVRVRVNPKQVEAVRVLGAPLLPKELLERRHGGLGRLLRVKVRVRVRAGARARV